MKNNILLDTHILLWSLLNPNELSLEITQIIEGAQQNNYLFISSITLWEVAMLVQKRRISVYEPITTFLNSIATIEGLNVVQISPTIAADSVSLDNFHGDPADRLIVATARELSAILFTRDQEIHNWASFGLIKAFKS